MEKLNKKIIITFLIIAICLLVGSLTYYIQKDYRPFKIDLFANEYISELIKSNFTICTHENLNSKYNETLFGPQTFIIGKDNCLLPSYPLGYPLILAISKFLNANLFKYINMIFLGILLTYIYKITKIFTNSKTSVITLILIATFSPVLLFTQLTFNTISATAIYFAAIYYFLKGDLSKNKKDFIIFGILTGVHMWIRFYDFIYYLPLIFLLNKENIKKILYFLVPFLLFLMPLIIISIQMYGTPIGILGLLNENSIMTPKEAYVSILGYEPGFFIGFESAINNLLSYLVLFCPVLFLVFIYMMLRSSIKKDTNSLRRKFNLFMFILIILTFLFFSTGAFQGFEYQKAILDSSYNRYFLIGFLTMILFLGINWNNLKKRFNKKIILLLISLFIITNFIILFSFSGILDVKEKQWSYKEKLTAFNDLPKEAIVFTKYNDIYFFPKAHVAYYTQYDKLNRINDTTQLIEKLLRGNHIIYFADDDYWMLDPAENYFNNLKNHNITRINNYLWQITK